MRKINRRDFLKAAGILAAASALTACGGSDSSSAAAGSGAAETAASLPAINEIKLGEDFQDVTADIKILTNRTDIVDTVYAGYAEQFHQLYPNITVTYEALTDYEESLTLRIMTGEWGDICFIPTSVSKADLASYFVPLGDMDTLEPIYNFIGDPSVKLIGCEAAGRGVDTPETAATIATGRLGIFHGMKSYFCQDAYGQIAPVYSISAGLDYPGIGPEHAYLHDTGRAEYVPVTDDESVEAFEYLARTEGIIPAIESAHAVVHAMKIAPQMGKDKIIVVCLSGRGDKDCAAIARYRGEDLHE